MNKTKGHFKDISELIGQQFDSIIKQVLREAKGAQCYIRRMHAKTRKCETNNKDKKT